MRVKIAINTREHFTVHGFTAQRYVVENPWFAGEADIATYTLPELLGTKLRALYQRKKGRDLFDLSLALQQGNAEPERLVAAFEHYMVFGGTPLTRAQFEANMAAKLDDPSFSHDVSPLIRTGLAYDPSEAWSRVHDAIITRLPGDPGRGTVNRDLEAARSQKFAICRKPGGACLHASDVSSVTA